MSSHRLKIVIPIAFVVLAVVVAAVIVQARPVAERSPRVVEPPLVRVLPVVKESAELAVISHGTVVPHTDSVIVAEVAGRIESVSPRFANGGSFSRGEVIAQIDARDYRVGLAQANAALVQAKLRLEREEAEAAVAREEWEQLGEGVPNPLAVRQPQLAEARAAVAAAEASVMQAQLNVDRSTIRAPFTGRLLEKKAGVGQFVAPGTPLGRLAATDYVEVELPVSGDELAYIDVAASPAVTLRARFAGAMHEWKGRIVRTSGQIDPKSRTLGLIARVEQPYRAAASQPLHIGLFVEGEIEGKRVDDVIAIPRGALRGREEVLVVDAHDRLHVRRVELARVTSTTAWIASGLEEGERVVLSTMEAPVAAMQVRTVVDGAQNGPAAVVKETR